jgi:expansin (peptidoglycan-binding protein)
VGKGTFEIEEIYGENKKGHYDSTANRLAQIGNLKQQVPSQNR